MKTERQNTILIIDDEPANIVSLRHMLSSDYTIYGVTDGMSGITAAKLQKPDLILLDIIMPEMDGYEVLARLKSAKETQDIPVIIITKLDNEESEEKGLILGAVDYIQKPFSSLVVKLRVQNLLKIVNRNRIINEQRSQQELLKSISRRFTTESNSSAMLSDTLDFIGEIMDVSQVLLYIIEDEGSAFTCRSEWKAPEFEEISFIGNQVDYDETIKKTINDLLFNNEKDLCLHSSNPYYKGIMKPFRKNKHNYITAPVFFMGKMCAVLDFSRADDGRDWTENELTFTVLIACVFSRLFERDAMERQFDIL